jgi:hypothetical protein
MGWMIGLGLLLFALAIGSLIAFLIAVMRFVVRTDQTSPIVYLSPAVSAFIALACFVIIRFISLPVRLYDLVGIGGLLVVAIGMTVGLCPVSRSGN